MSTMQLDLVPEQYCSRCREFQPTSAFGRLIDGRPRQTCERHNANTVNKLSLILDDYSTLLTDIQSWFDEVRLKM